LAFSEKDFQASLNTKNITFFAFTASPKDKTIEMFGIDKPDGGKKEFHEYTTEQAISEGVILDITKNIYVKKSLPLIIKKINDDPLLNTLPTKRKIEAIIDNDEKSIEPQTTIDLKMFFDKTYNLLDRNGKAMIVCSSIENAILRYNEIIKQLKRDYGNKICKVLIAFSGSKKIDNKEYTEDSINNIKSSIEDEFDKQDYKILVCANKFQTGFDQKKLCSLFIHKKMKGVNLYQTFQRINRKYEMVSSNAQIIIKKQSDDLLVLD
jgi:type I restriction enzyme R subunit